MMEVVVTDGATSGAKLHPVKSSHQQTNTQLFTGWMPILLPNQAALKGKYCAIITLQNLKSVQ